MEHDLPWDWEGSKESYYEKMEPRISQLKNTLGKGKVRSALGMAADTGFGRGIQNLRAKTGAAITGNQPVR